MDEFVVKKHVVLLIYYCFFYFFRDWEGANNVISSMSNIGLSPDADTYKELLNGYAKFGVCFAISSSFGGY